MEKLKSDNLENVSGGNLYTDGKYIYVVNKEFTGIPSDRQADYWWSLNENRRNEVASKIKEILAKNNKNWQNNAYDLENYMYDNYNFPYGIPADLIEKNKEFGIKKWSYD